MFKNNLKQLRLQSGCSQQELAKAIGISQSAINAWETGKSTASADYLVLLANFFEISVEELLGVETLPNTQSPKMEILSVYEQLNKANKAVALKLLKSLLESQKEDL